jgi:hypothetical protein
MRRVAASLPVCASVIAACGGAELARSPELASRHGGPDLHRRRRAQLGGLDVASPDFPSAMKLFDTSALRMALMTS